MSNSDKNSSLELAMLGWMSEFAGQGLLVTDENLNIRSFNKWFEKQSEKSEKELFGNNLLEVFPELGARGFDRYYRDALNGQSRILSHRLHKYLLPMTPSAGVTAFAQMQQRAQISPLFEGERVIGTITVIEDVTERVAREKELNIQIEERERLLASEYAARQFAEENSRLKDEFLASVSHEIRTPLNAISGWTQILLTGERSEEKFSHALSTIQRNVSSQMQIIDDLLDQAFQRNDAQNQHQIARDGVIIASADIQDSTREMVATAGANAFINKPLSPEKVLHALESVISEAKTK